MGIYAKSVTPDISKIFSLKIPDLHILNYFGINGPSYRNQVHLAVELSPRHAAKHVNYLFNDGYFHLIHSKQYRNEDKFIKLYGLSIKGFIASLYGRNISENFYFKKYISLFPEELKKPVKTFLNNVIFEFILYHKSIGLKIDNILDMSKYTKGIIYDYDLITNDDDLNMFKKIDDAFSVIDEIRDILTDIKSSEPDEPDQPHHYVSSNSKLDSDEYFTQERIVDNLNEEMMDDHHTDSYYPRESIKYEFLINFWPYVIDEIGKGSDLKQLDNVSEKSSPFGLKSYEENINEFYNKKQSMIMTQWMKRKLNFQPTVTFSFNPEELRSRKYF